MRPILQSITCLIAAIAFPSLLAAKPASPSATSSKPPAPSAQAFVPGTGTFMDKLCDDFEDPEWGYTYNMPKSSEEQDDQERGPGARSSNGLWAEGAKRGTPDLVKRVPTPAGGIEGSTGSLLFATLRSGIPGSVSNTQQQDDLLMKFDRRLKGGSIPVSWRPSCTVRVYLPPFEEWERRPGPSFGMRADVRGRKGSGEVEPYWPGMFIMFWPKNRQNPEDFAQLSIRSGLRGNDIHSLKIMEPGWWTLGMSFTPDGQVHYYAHAGVADLTADDYIMSSFPYGDRCMTFNNFFFNVANIDNGKSWSTKWIIDDPKVFVMAPEGQDVAQLYRPAPQPKMAPQNRGRATANANKSRSASNQKQQQQR
jgi:hypothetical protein